MSDDGWTVHEHGPIEQLAENLWRVSGSLPRMTLRRTMTVVRMGGGRLVIHNAIALDEAGMRALEALGTPSVLLVPNGFHRLDAAAFKRRYPALRVLAPRGSMKKVAEKVAVDGSYEDFPADETARTEAIAGIADMEGALVVRSTDGVTLVLTDCVFNMDRKSDFMGNLITRMLGSAPGPRVSRVFRWLGVKDKAAFRENLERMAATPGLVRVVVAHEKVASGADAPAALRQAATFV
jgi:hypothetical protein